MRQMTQPLGIYAAVAAGRIALAAAALAFGPLIQSGATGAATEPEALATALPAGDPAVPASDAGDGAGADAPVSGPAALLTADQVRAGMEEAEQRRAEAMRPDPSVPKSVAEQWGVEVIRVDNTADGFWLDFRFRVTDAEKALPLFDSRIKPYLESEQSGVKLAVPSAAKVGALRTTNRGHNVKPGKIYNIMFANPGFHVKPGQKVSVVIGDFKVEHLTVN
jgi:hypothetical protein